MKTIRCSALPSLFRCAPSVDPQELAIEAYNEAGDLGTATHLAMQMVVIGLNPDLDALALRFAVDRDDLGRLVWYGRQAWKELAPSFPDPETEVSVEADLRGVSLVGHVDLLSVLSAANVRFVDWKSGRKEDADYYAQLAGYATCLILGNEAEEATASVVWLRSQNIETFVFRKADAEAFASQVETKAQDRTYRHGEHCGNCARSHNCEALITVSRRDIAIFQDDAVAEEIATMDAARVVGIRRSLGALEKFAKSADEAIRRRVMSSGPLPSGDGYRLEFVEENGKREIDTLKAWPILQEHLTDEELAGCVTVSASKADDAVAKKAGRGNGKVAKEALRVELEQAGALVQPKIPKLKEVRIAKELPGKTGTGE